MASYGYTFTSGDTVTPTKLNNARTITDIVNADIKSDAAIVGTKISPNFGAQNVVTTGTVTADKLVPSGTSATGNGLYLPATNTVAISTNGGERLRVDATGNTAIGTTTTTAARLTVADASANDALRITQTGAGNALVVEDVATDGSPTVIDASGNVVIGHTSAPTVASSVHPLNVIGVGAALARAAADAVGSVITFVKSRSAGIGAARSIVLNNDELGAIEFAADNGANLNVLAASISAECDGTPGAADMPGRIVFRTTADGAASPTERMRITNAGNVGIGKTPTTALDVNGTVTATGFAGPLTGNVTGNLTGTASAIADSSVTNAKVATGAAIAHNKLANITAGQVLLGNASNVPTATALSGDVTVNSSGVTAIGSGVIVNADVSASAGIGLSKLATGALPTGITVASANLVNGTIVDADVSASAAIAGTKLSPNFGSQNAVTTGTVSAAKLIPTGTSATGNGMYLPATNAVAVSTNGVERIRIDSAGNLFVGYSSGGDTNSPGLVKAAGYNTKAGESASLGANNFNINWSSPNASLYIDDTNLGTIQVTSDYRIKRNIITQTDPAISRVKEMRPVKYNIADFGDIFKADDMVREGFIAHELAKIVPSAVEGIKDDPDQIQSLRLDALCAVLVKAIQELTERVEALEAQKA